MKHSKNYNFIRVNFEAMLAEQLMYKPLNN